MTPFCDFLACSFPLERWDEVDSGVRPLMDLTSAEIVPIQPGPGVIYRPRLGGVVRLQQRYHVGVISASGGALCSLRAADLLGEYLMLVGCGPHKVTRLDATVDLLVEAPVHVARIATRAREGSVGLSRKAVPASQVTTYESLDARGDLTGTVYLGQSTARVRGVIYDKRHERESKGEPDPGPCLRIEVRCRDVGACLRDAWDPSPMFFHFAAPDLVPAPASVLRWNPNGEGFKLDVKTDWDPVQLMEHRLESSAEIERLVELAFAAGPEGPKLLLQKLGKRLNRSVLVRDTAREAMERYQRQARARTESVA